jgi:hypothetical protein
VLIDGEAYVDAAVSENTPVRSLRAACGPPVPDAAVDTLLLRGDPRWRLGQVQKGPDQADDLLRFTLRILCALLNRAMRVDDADLRRCTVVEMPRATDEPTDSQLLSNGVTARDMLQLYATGARVFAEVSSAAAAAERAKPSSTPATLGREV